MALTDKQEAFVNEYLSCWNATKAAIAAGYSERSAYSQGSRLLKDAEIASRVRERIEANAMSADEVLARLAEHARGDVADLVDPATLTLDWKKATQKGATRLIKKIKQTVMTAADDRQTEIFEFELYDAQAALVHIGKQLGLFKTNIAVEDWRTQAVADIRAGKLTYAALAQAFDHSLAAELFAAAGIAISAGQSEAD